MGTNYYCSKFETCRECGHPSIKEYHIGKASYGWQFAYHAIPELGLYTHEDWIEFLTEERLIVRDEYARQYTVKGFRELVEARPVGKCSTLTSAATGTNWESFDHEFC